MREFREQPRQSKANRSVFGVSRSRNAPVGIGEREPPRSLPAGVSLAYVFSLPHTQRGWLEEDTIVNLRSVVAARPNGARRLRRFRMSQSV